MPDVSQGDNDLIFQLLMFEGEDGAAKAIKMLTDAGFGLSQAFAQVNQIAETVDASLKNMANHGVAGFIEMTTAVESLKSQLKSVEPFFENTDWFDPLGDRLSLTAKQIMDEWGQATRQIRDFTLALDEAAQHQANMQALPNPGAFQGLEADETSGEYRFGTAVGGPGAIEDASGGGGGGPGKIGSQFALGHALTAAGRTVGAPGLTQAGAFIYMEEGLRKIGPLFEELNATIEASPGVLEPLIGGLAGLGVPMAGLLAVVVPVAAAIGGVVIAYKIFENNLKDVSLALKDALATQQAYYQAVKTMTTEEAKIKISSLEETAAANQRAKAETQGAIEALQKQTNINMEFGKTLPAQLGQPFRDLSAQLDKNNEAIIQTNAELGRYEGGLKSGSFAANDAAEALLKQVAASNDAHTAIAILTAAIKDGQVSAEKAAPVMEALWKKLDDAAIAGANQVEQDVMRHYQQQQIIEKGNVDEAKKNREQLQAEYDATSAAWMNLLKNGDQNSQAVQDQEATYAKHAQFLLDQMAEYDNSVIPATQHTKDMADSIKKVDDAAKESTKGWEKYFAAYQSAQDQLASQRANAISKEKEQEAALTQGSLEDTQARTRISIEEGRKVTTIVNDTANAIVDIRTKMGQQDLAAQIDYNRKLMDDQTKYQEQQQTDWTNMYRKETDNLTAHQQKLADIQAKQSNDQQSALLNRNFLQLAQQAQSKQTEIDAENTAYARKQAAEQLAYQRQLEDLARHYAEQRTQDFVNYQRKLTDDQLHARQEIQQKEVDEQRKLQVARTWEQQALADLTQNEQYKISILRQGLAQELVLYQQQAAAKLAIAAREAAGSSFPSGLPGMPGTGGMHVGGGLGFKDTGGPFAAGETFMKGDISEMFTFGGQSYSIPGAAIVHPLQGGTATPTSGGHQFNIPITINQKSGQDAALMASQEVYRRVKQMLGEV